jgi:hypothetical protein
MGAEIGTRFCRHQESTHNDSKSRAWSDALKARFGCVLVGDNLGRAILESYRQLMETRGHFFLLVSIYASLSSSLSICC